MNTATERRVAYATTAAPVIIGAGAPLLDSGAAGLAGLIVGGAGAFAAANYMNRVPNSVMEQIPGNEIIRAHRSTLFLSSVTSAAALAVGAFGGGSGADNLAFGFLDFPSVPAAVSLAWWGGVALVPLKLRAVFGSKKPGKAKAAPSMQATAKPVQAFGAVAEIYRKWAEFISGPEGTNPAQELTVRGASADSWRGVIRAPMPQPVNVTRETVGALYEVPAGQVTITPGTHPGEKLITVHLVPPPEMDPNTLEGAWLVRVARRGGPMPHTHLEGVQDDPNTGGKAALVVADEDISKLPSPDRMELAGALRTNPLLISYEPRLNPREGVIRIMHTNPLEEGRAFPGPHVLKANANGYVVLGQGISGHPARVQMADPKLGAQHICICGVTGSGKGGAAQLVALSAHANGHAVIYADPKGSSNPAVEELAAHSGTGLDGALGSLRVAYSLLQHRIAESAEKGQKNFVATKERPQVTVILDEASRLLGEEAQDRKEAAFIVDAIATQGRSLGIQLVLINQILQLDQLGGLSSIRDNIIYGGALILLRSDSSQKNLVDLPDHFEGCNPADIPAVWREERGIIFDPDMPEDDPRRTFGLGYIAGPGGHPEMMRVWILEDASPYINHDAIAFPADMPNWDDREELALVCVVEDEEGNWSVGEITVTAGREPSADDKVLAVLAEHADPLELEVIYLHKDAIGEAAGLEGSTLNNALSKLVKADKIHRQKKDGKEVRGMYGAGSEPITG
ncbi:type IV secretory system conjugative DNA transfer family protein [Streptomyces sp. NPDC096153]|uniref:type IV secretory system conjugative DNA transfer family protein n=1 Tax=Streptomyces sp. NPDC096153 TaxID=3155548 RepID=UPI003326E3FB